MTTRVELPDGCWVDLYDPEEMTPRLSEPVSIAQGAMTPEIIAKMAELDPVARAMGAGGFTPEEVRMIDALQAAKVASYAKAWKLPAGLKLPKEPTWECMPDVPFWVMNPVSLAIAKLERPPSPADGDPNGEPDPANPTGRSTRSKRSSKAARPASTAPAG